MKIVLTLIFGFYSRLFSNKASSEELLNDYSKPLTIVLFCFLLPAVVLGKVFLFERESSIDAFSLALMVTTFCVVFAGWSLIKKISIKNLRKYNASDYLEFVVLIIVNVLCIGYLVFW